MYKEYPSGQAPEALERLASQFKAADAFIIVSGEYNHSIPPALSNMLDHFLAEYFWRPSAIVCYSAGPFGGVRAAMQLRAMLCELGTPSIPSLLPIAKVQDAFDDEGHPHDEAYHRRADRFLGELEWYARASSRHGKPAFRIESRVGETRHRRRVIGPAAVLRGSALLTFWERHDFLSRLLDVWP